MSSFGGGPGGPSGGSSGRGRYAPLDPPSYSSVAGGQASGAGKQPASDSFYHLEGQNDQHLDALASKVSALKGVSIQIHDDVNEQNRFLDEQTSGFDNVGALLQNSRRRFQAVMDQPQSRRICYIVCTVLVLFLFFYALAHRRPASD